MGAKTGLLVFADRDVPSLLRDPARPDEGATEALARQVHPGYSCERIDDGALGYAVYPPDDVLYAAALGGVDVLCDQRFMIDYPSQLPAHLHELAAGRRVMLHAMHSVAGWFAFAVWEGGQLVRSLSLSPGSGIQENVGEPLEFERPFWAGEHPVHQVPGWREQEPYPLPFQPLDVGEEALRALFGFVLEGTPSPDDVDPYRVPVLGFRVVDPDGAEHAERQAAMKAIRRATGRSGTLRPRPNGTYADVTDQWLRH